MRAAAFRRLRERGIPAVMTAHDLKIACPAYKMFNQHGICERCKHGNLLNVAIHRCVHGSLALSTLIMLESGVHRLLRLYRDNLDRVIVPSKFYGQKLAEWGWPREQLVHIPNYIVADDYEPQYAPGRYFLYFGRLAPEKGVDTVVQAAARVGVHLRIAGTGPAGGTGIDKVTSITLRDMTKGALTLQHPEYYLFFTETSNGRRAARDFLRRLRERTENRARGSRSLPSSLN